jgi:hypothetical protein
VGRAPDVVIPEIQRRRPHPSAPISVSYDGSTGLDRDDPTAQDGLTFRAAGVAILVATFVLAAAAMRADAHRLPPTPRSSATTIFSI